MMKIRNQIMLLAKCPIANYKNIPDKTEIFDGWCMPK